MPCIITHLSLVISYRVKQIQVKYIAFKIWLTRWYCNCHLCISLFLGLHKIWFCKCYWKMYNVLHCINEYKALYLTGHLRFLQQTFLFICLSSYSSFYSFHCCHFVVVPVIIVYDMVNLHQLVCNYCMVRSLFTNINYHPYLCLSKLPLDFHINFYIPKLTNCSDQIGWLTIPYQLSINTACILSVAIYNTIIRILFDHSFWSFTVIALVTISALYWPNNKHSLRMFGT